MKPKKILFALAAIVALTFMSYADFAIAPVSVISKNEVAVNSHLSYKDRLMVAQMKAFMNMTGEQYGKLRGKRLNFFERISFRLSRHRM